MFEDIFHPKSVALIGASEEEKSAGAGLARNLLNSKVRNFFVNPNRETVFGRKCFNNILDIKEVPDLAIIAVPSKVVLKVLEQCGKGGIKNAIIISAGFAEAGNKKGEKEITRIAREYKINLLGPNCLGIITPVFNGTFAPLPVKGVSRGAAFLSQSGALIDSAMGEIKNFSYLISYGNEAGIRAEDMFSYFSENESVSSVLIYLEGIGKGRGAEFIEKGKILSKKKPVVILKGGKTKKGSGAVYSHTGKVAGSSKIYSAAFKKAGFFEVDNFSALLDLGETLSMKFSPSKTDKLKIITNGGALGVILSDLLEKEEIKNFAVKDILGDARPRDYRKEMEKTSEENILVAVTPQIMTCPEKLGEEIISFKKEKNKNVFACVLGGAITQKARIALREENIPVFETAKVAALFFKFLLWKKNFENRL